MHMTMDFILGAIIAGNPGPSMADFQLEIGPIVVAGAAVEPEVAPIGPVGGRGRAASSGSGSRGHTGSRSMGAGASRGGYSIGPSRGGYSAAPRRGGVGVGPSGSSFSAGRSRGGVGAGPSRGGAAVGRGMSNVSADLQPAGREGYGIARGSVKQRGRVRGLGGPTEAIAISSDMCNLILQLLRSRE